MGTNYYWRPEREPSCPTCGHATEPDRLHIGKSSLGWVFGFQGHPERGLTSWASWKSFLAMPGGVIEDEYGATRTLEEFVSLVETKQTDPRSVTRQPGPRQAGPELMGPRLGYRDGQYSDPEGYDFCDRPFS